MTEQPHTPTAAEAASFWADVPIEQEWPVQDATDGQERRSGSLTCSEAQALRKRLTRAHSKPTVRKGIYVWWMTCRMHATMDGFDTHPEALAAALAHVAEHHTKPLLAAGEAAELAQKPAEDAFWERYRRTLADDDDPFPPDLDHLSRVADDLTTLTANRRALDDAHRQGGPRS